jgi:hypothetical protein
MTLFKRNSNSVDENEDQKNKGDWKRPASESDTRQQVMTGLVLNKDYRHCVQTAATKGMAAYPDSEDGAADSLRHRDSLRSHRRPFDLGLVTGNSKRINIHIRAYYSCRFPKSPSSTLAARMQVPTSQQQPRANSKICQTTSTS